MHDLAEADEKALREYLENVEDDPRDKPTATRAFRAALQHRDSLAAHPAAADDAEHREYMLGCGIGAITRQARIIGIIRDEAGTLHPRQFDGLIARIEAELPAPPPAAGPAKEDKT